jgi:hypothetical protein
MTPSLQRGTDAIESLRHYAAALRSLPEIDAAARGRGLLSADTEGGIVRRMPMVARIGSTPVLPLSLETLRVASGEPLFLVHGGSAGVEAVGIGDVIVPTQPDGRVGPLRLMMLAVSSRPPTCWVAKSTPIGSSASLCSSG